MKRGMGTEEEGEEEVGEVVEGKGEVPEEFKRKEREKVQGGGMMG